MTKEASEKEKSIDFMLEEYKQMGAAFFDLSSQKSQMFRFYLILVTIPISLVAAVLGLGPEKGSLAGVTLLFLLPVLMIAIAIAGLLMTAIVVDIRFEAIIYARTINMIRRFFKELNSSHDLGAYLVLPDTEEVPKFNEQPWNFKRWRWKWSLGVGATFLEVVLMASINSIFLTVGLFLLVQQVVSSPLSYLLVSVCGLLFLIAHVSGYIYFATKRDEEWSRQTKSETR